MADELTRRDLMKGAAATVSYLALDGVAGATAEAAGLPGRADTAGSGATVGDAPNGTILPLNCTSQVILPPPGRSLQKFSFDFPEPSVAFNKLLIGFRLYTFENTYGLDRAHMTVTPQGDGLLLECSGFVYAGGQLKAPGRLRANIRPNGDFAEWDVVAEMEQPIKSVTTVVRGLPRGKIAAGSGGFFDPKENEILLGYPWGNGGRSTDTPLAVIEAGTAEYYYVSALNEEVRANRMYFEPAEDDRYRIELVYENPGWKQSPVLEGARWRVGRVSTAADAVRPHIEHVQRAFQIPDWQTRADVPGWFREIELFVSIHGMDWTGYIFNDFAKALRTLEWVSQRIEPRKVMVFLPAWNGRYYWEYSIYKVDDRMGGDEGFRRLISEGHRMGFRFLPMFGLQAANTHLSVYPQIADASTRAIDDNSFYLAWVDWDNDRHMEGWGRFMNVAVESWRNWMYESIAYLIENFGVDGYFLDIAGGWVNNRQGDMLAGLRTIVAQLRRKYPNAIAVGEFSYDALMAVLPLYQIFPSWGYPPAFSRYCRSFSHLSHPAPGRGSSGVHESGFGHFNPKTLSLNPHEIPTITVVDDTFAKYRHIMAEIIERAKARAANKAMGARA
ncbi:MAG: hypothetical protein ACRD2E_13175 [Terriglobales bacterium]